MAMFVVPPVPPAFVLRVTEGEISLEAELAARARQDGWSNSQAGWIGKLGAAAVKDDAAPVDRDKAYTAGCQALAIGYFDHALAEGKSRLVAFLTVVDLERQVVTRRGGKALDYPQAQLETAYKAVDIASGQGLSSKDQIAAGFEALRLQGGPGAR